MVFIIVIWWMSLSCDLSHLLHETRWAAAHAQITSQIQSFDLHYWECFSFGKICSIWTLVSVCRLLIYRGLKEDMWFTAKSLAIVWTLLMDSFPRVLKWPPWPHSTHVHWQEPRERGELALSAQRWPCRMTPVWDYQDSKRNGLH